MQQSIDISCLAAHSSKPAAAVCGGRMMGQTDVRTPGSFIDPAAHTTPALPNAMCRSVKGRIAGAVKLIFQRRNIAEIVKIVYLRCWRWHKAHYKVISGQRTLGKFYRPASITRGPHSSGPRSACPQKRVLVCVASVVIIPSFKLKLQIHFSRRNKTLCYKTPTTDSVLYPPL